MNVYEKQGDLRRMHFNRGQALARSGDYAAAVAEYSQVVGMNPQYPAAYHFRALAHNALGHWQDAQADWTRTVDLAPGMYSAFYNRGLVRLKLADPAGAEADFSKAIALQPDYFHAYFGRGKVRLDHGNVRGALRDFLRAAHLEPASGAGWSFLGQCLAARGALRSAVECFSRAIAHGAPMHSAHANRGAARARLGEIEPALDDLERAIETAPDYAPAYEHRAALRLRMQQIESALEDADRALALKPDHAAAHALRGAALEAQGAHDPAMIAYAQALDLDPEETRARLGLQRLLTAASQRPALDIPDGLSLDVEMEQEETEASGVEAAVAEAQESADVDIEPLIEAPAHTDEDDTGIEPAIEETIAPTQDIDSLDIGLADVAQPPPAANVDVDVAQPPPAVDVDVTHAPMPATEPQPAPQPITPIARPRLRPLLVNGLLALGVLGVGVAVAGWLIHTRPIPPRVETPVEARLVEIVPAVRTSAPLRIPVMGTVIPASNVALQSEVTGRVVEQSAELVPGGRIKEGELIARLDARDYDLVVEQQRAAVERAQLDLRMEEGRQAVAQREWSMLQEKEGPAGNGPDLALRRPQLLSAQAALAAAQSGLKLAELNVDRASIRAPFNALVQEESLDIGQVVMPGQRIAMLAGTDRFWVQASVPVDQLERIRFPSADGAQGSAAVVIHSAGPENRMERAGRVERLLGELDPSGRMARVLIAVDDPLDLANGGRQALLLGAYVSVRIEGADLLDVYRVPRAAVHEGDQVRVMNAGDELEVRTVQIAWREEDSVLVRAGLSDGDRIVVSPISAPMPGMKLRVAE